VQLEHASIHILKKEVRLRVIELKSAHYILTEYVVLFQFSQAVIADVIHRVPLLSRQWDYVYEVR
jgi:hypothetical protein